MAVESDDSTDRRLLRLHPDDDCLVAARRLTAGETVIIEGTPVVLAVELGFGHKLAAHHLAAGATVRKCGAVIGRTSCEVQTGEHLHLHNLQSTYIAAHLVGGSSSAPSAPSSGI